jgi:DNA-binding response OmpR family regulator
MRILVVEDEFERAGLHVEPLRRSAFAADRAATPVDALISRPRQHLNDERAGAPTVPVRGVSYMLAKSAS